MKTIAQWMHSQPPVEAWDTQARSAVDPSYVNEEGVRVGEARNAYRRVQFLETVPGLSLMFKLAHDTGLKITPFVDPIFQMGAAEQRRPWTFLIEGYPALTENDGKWAINQLFSVAYAKGVPDDFVVQGKFAIGTADPATGFPVVLVGA